MRIKKRYILSAVISIAILAFLFYRADFGQVVSILANADLKYVLIAACFPFIDVLLKSLRWKFFLDAYKIKIRPLDVISSYLAALFVANVTPARVGEATRPYFLKKKYKITFFELLPAIVVERFIDLAILLLYSLTFFILFSFLVSPLLKLIMLVMFVLLLVVLVIMLKKSLTISTVNFLFKAFGFLSFTKKLKPKVDKMLDTFYKGTKQLKSAKLIPIVLLTMVAWGGEGLILYLSTLALGINVPFIYCLGFLSLAVLGGVISSLPGGLGSTEAILFAFFVLLGTAEPLALSVAILYRFLSFGIGISFSSIFFFRELKS